MKIRVRILRAVGIALIVLTIFTLAAVGVFAGVRESGRKKLYGQADGGQMVEAMSGHSEEEEGPEGRPSGWQEGDIFFRGKYYRYNEDILTFLFLGIDKMQEVAPVKNGIDGGQSDAIFLLVLDPHGKEIHVIGIPRDTMAEVDVYTKDGEFKERSVRQITLQHGYGDGAELSCERSREAVSRLFYNLPIHGYCAINMGAIPLINDAVGGVDVEALESIRFKGFRTEEGEAIHLEGMGSYHYLHYRDVTSFNSAGQRLERQKQYLGAYAAKAMEAVKTDITLPVTLYRTLSRYMVTDISADEAGYLASQILGYHFDSGNLYSLEGETVMGDRFEEFYIDEAAFYELVLKVFYEEVTD